MPRIWIANEWKDPDEECGGLPYDYCNNCFYLALDEWKGKLETDIENGKLPMSTDPGEMIVDHDDHPLYEDDHGGYTCGTCGRGLTEKDD